MFYLSLDYQNNNHQMSLLFTHEEDRSKYIDRRKMSQSTNKEKFVDGYHEQIKTSTTLYIGQMSHWTTESQVWAVLSSCGRLIDVVMGINREDRTPCGFCFAVFATRADAEVALQFLKDGVIDDRPVTVSFDRGGDLRGEGRHWGRAWTGGQVRDDYRDDIDLGRGGENGRRRWETKAKGGAVEVVETEKRPVYHWMQFDIEQWRKRER